MTAADELALRRAVTAALRAKFLEDDQAVLELLAPYDAADVALAALSLAGTLAVLASEGQPVELLERVALMQAGESE